MAIVELYSKSQKKLRGEITDIYTYDNLPQVLRVQIVHIIQDTLQHYMYRDEAYSEIHAILCREYGVFTLGKSSRESDSTSILNHLLNVDEIESALDVIQLMFAYISMRKERWPYAFSRRTATNALTPEQSIAEMNCRLKAHSVGYQF